MFFLLGLPNISFNHILIVPSLQMPLSAKHKKVQTSTSPYQRQQQQCIYHHCQLSHVIPGHAILVAVCILMLPMLEVATEHKQLISTNPVEQCHCMTFSHASLVLPSLSNVLSAMVIQNTVVRSNMCLSRFSHSLSYLSICHVSLCLGFSVSFNLRKVLVVLLLLLSGDIETNPGPDGELASICQF